MPPRRLQPPCGVDPEGLDRTIRQKGGPGSIPSRTRPRALVSRDTPRIICAFSSYAPEDERFDRGGSSLKSREPSLCEAGDGDLARRHGNPGGPGSVSSTPGVPTFTERNANLRSERISSFQSRPRCFQGGHRDYVIRGPKGSSPVIEGIKPGHCASRVRSARGPGPGFAAKETRNPTIRILPAIFRSGPPAGTSCGLPDPQGSTRSSVARLHHCRR
jgi:hypothetical protein